MDNTPEPTSIWQLKPWWCQPWSILLTGFILIGGSWLLCHRWWVTLLVTLPTGSWMVFFTLLYPSLARQAGLLDKKLG